MDRTILEIFVNGRQVTFFPTRRLDTLWIGTVNVAVLGLEDAWARQ